MTNQKNKNCENLGVFYTYICTRAKMHIISADNSLVSINAAVQPSSKV